MLSSRPVITGIGLVTPLGGSLPATWNALMEGQFIEDHAKVPLEFEPRLPRISNLAICAAREAVGEHDLTNAALIVGTSKGPVENWLRAASRGSPGTPVARASRPCMGASTGIPALSNSIGLVRTGGTPMPLETGVAIEQLPPPSRLSDVESTVRAGLSTVAFDVATELSVGGPRLTVSAACASGLHALIRGAMLIQSGQFERVLVVACEASVCSLFLASFSRLGVLSPAGFGCRPFDRFRAGFLMSEAAASVLLEARGTGVGVEIERFALGADATHLTGMDPEGRTLRHVLRAAIGDAPVDVVHAHGTGTQLNDPIELAALDDLVGPGARPALYSHKGALGHSLGAAGLVSVVLNVACHQTGAVPPNVRMAEPMPSRHLSVCQASSHRAVNRSLAVAAGFGGAIAAVTLRQIAP